MSTDPLFSDIELFLKNSREDRAGLAFLESLGYEGATRFIEETEAAYQRASADLELTGEEVARITALAHAVARACRIDAPESKEALSKLVEVGWLMSRWFNRNT
jgi:RecB family exonuclease